MAVEIPGHRFAGVLEPPLPPAAPEPGKLLSRARAAAGGERFLAGGRPLVLVNDATRPTPTAAMLAHLWPALRHRRPRFLVAAGTHRPPTRGECHRIFGDLWEEVAADVAFHDAGDASRLVELGRTPAGTRVLLNRQVVEAKKILVLGSVEPHYFAGFTGGRKIFLPGVAAAGSIEQNHRLALDGAARALALAGNPVHADMDAALDLLGDREIFALLVVLDRERRPQAAFAGDIRAAFRRAATAAAELCGAPCPRREEIVLAAAAPPLDRDFYQAQKSVEHGLLALREGGILVLVSGCREGVGDAAFLEIMDGRPPRAVVEEAHREYRLGRHKAARLAAAAMKHRLWAVTGVGDEVVSRAFMRPFADVGTALAQALAARPHGRVWFLPDAGNVVPRCGEAPA